MVTGDVCLAHRRVEVDEQVSRIHFRHLGNAPGERFARGLLGEYLGQANVARDQRIHARLELGLRLHGRCRVELAAHVRGELRAHAIQRNVRAGALQLFLGRWTNRNGLAGIDRGHDVGGGYPFLAVRDAKAAHDVRRAGLKLFRKMDDLHSIPFRFGWRRAAAPLT